MSGIIKRLMKCCEDDYSDERYSNDNEYKEQAENADNCISAIRRELVDSQKLDILLNSIEKCNEIEKQYGKADKKCNILLEINIGDEESKGGISCDRAAEIAYLMPEYKNVVLKGLMCVPPRSEDESVRKYFEKMRKLFVDISDKKLDNINMSILSMGMSGDYPYAIAEGSTLIRVGRGIFGERNYNNV